MIYMAMYTRYCRPNTRHLHNDIHGDTPVIAGLILDTYTMIYMTPMIYTPVIVGLLLDTYTMIYMAMHTRYCRPNTRHLHNDHGTWQCTPVIVGLLLDTYTMIYMAMHTRYCRPTTRHLHNDLHGNVHPLL